MQRPARTRPGVKARYADPFRKGRTRSIRVLVADDRPIVLRGLVDLFQAVEDFQVVARCVDGPTVVAEVAATRPDVAVVDSALPARGGLAVVQRLREEGLPGHVILLASEMDEAESMDAVRAGARGILFMDQAPEELTLAVRRVAEGERWISRHLLEDALEGALVPEKRRAEMPEGLTPREMDVVRLVSDGLSNKQIAREFGISAGTVKIHLHNVFRKLEVESRLQVALAARSRRLL